MDPGLGADDLPGRIAGYDALVVRSTKVAARSSTPPTGWRWSSGPARGPTPSTPTRPRPGRPGRERAGPQRRRGRGADHGPAARDRPPDPRQRRRPARGATGTRRATARPTACSARRWASSASGSIGLAVAERAAAFGIHLQALAKPGRRRTPSSPGRGARDRAARLVARAAGRLRHRLAARAGRRDTKHLVDEEFLAPDATGAILLNTSRGDVVDEAALLEALDAGTVRAGLDVFADEPGKGTAEWHSPLAQHPRVVATHHIGASTGQAQRAIAAGVVEIVDAFAAGEARNCVNLDPDRLGSATPHRAPPRPGRRARPGPRPAEHGPVSTSSTWRTGCSAAARRRSRRSTSAAPLPTGCSTTSRRGARARGLPDQPRRRSRVKRHRRQRSGVLNLAQTDFPPSAFTVIPQVTLSALTSSQAVPVGRKRLRRLGDGHDGRPVPDTDRDVSVVALDAHDERRLGVADGVGGELAGHQLRLVDEARQPVVAQLIGDEGPGQCHALGRTRPHRLGGPPLVHSAPFLLDCRREHEDCRAGSGRDVTTSFGIVCRCAGTGSGTARKV